MTSPKPVHRHRNAEYQARVDKELKKLAIYEFEACPFCIKVRRALKRMDLNIELRNVQKVTQHREALMAGGGVYQVPCLRIEKDDGSVQWMYESSDIIRYLQERYLE
jgi:glutaredoxin